MTSAVCQQQKMPPGISFIAHEGCRERVSKSLLLSLQFSERISVTKQAKGLANPHDYSVQDQCCMSATVIAA